MHGQKISEHDRREALSQHRTSPSSPLSPPSTFEKTPPSGMRSLVTRNQSGGLTKAAAQAAVEEFGPPPPISRGLDTRLQIPSSVQTRAMPLHASTLKASKGDLAPGIHLSEPSTAVVGISGPQDANKQPLQWVAAPKLKQEPYQVVVGRGVPQEASVVQGKTTPVQKSNEIKAAGPEADPGEDPSPPCLTRFYRLEPYSHGTIEVGQGQGQRATVVNEISRLLLSQKVHLEFVSQDFQWNCSFTNQGMYVLFVVRLFVRQPDGSEGGATGPRSELDGDRSSSSATIPLRGLGSADHVLEFSKRYGDTATFLQIFRETLQGLRPNGPHSLESNAAQLEPALTSSSQVLDQDLEEPPQFPETDIAHFVQQVKAMVQSGFIDAILEGTRALAALSASPEHVVVLHECEVGPLLFKTLQVLLEDDLRDTIQDDGSLTMVARTFAMTCLANLAADPTIISGKNFCDAPEAPVGFQLLVKQLRNGTYLDAAMRREATRTLVNLARDDESLHKLVECLGRDYWEDFRQDFRCDDLLDLDMQAQARIVCQSVDGAFKALC